MSHHHALLYEKMNEKAKAHPLMYTSSVLNKVCYDAGQVTKSGTSTLLEDFKEYLSWKEFDALRSRDDFRNLYSL